MILGCKFWVYLYFTLFFYIMEYDRYTVGDWQYIVTEQSVTVTESRAGSTNYIVRNVILTSKFILKRNYLSSI